MLATKLEVPWAIAFLPDGSALVTLRDRAQLLHVRAGSAPVSLGSIPGVVPGGEGGLLGVAVSPGYARDHRVFLYYTAASANRPASRRQIDDIAVCLSHHEMNVEPYG